MSAWFVGSYHVDALLSWGRQNGAIVPTTEMNEPQYDLSKARLDTMTLIGKGLLAENIRSLRSRYGDRHNEWMAGHEAEADAYVFTSLNEEFTPVTIIKACDCYDYQACETHDYRQTPAAAIIDAIRDHAIKAGGFEMFKETPDIPIPGWSDAPWGLKPMSKAA
jgi:hypothetical protein